MMKTLARLLTHKACVCLGFLLIGVSSCEVVPPSSDNGAVYARNVKRGEWLVKKNSVYDGDTFRAINQTTKEEIKVRLACIDAPEKDQPLGIASRDFLRSLLNKGDKVYLQVVDTDRYGRQVAEVFVPTPQGEIAVNGEMVRKGWVWFYRKYSKNCNVPVYDQAEKLAQNEKLGVWSKNYTPPWEWRKR
jgi:micrococcal nuclease